MDYVGQTLIVTDGTTLLGGDDKAGVAEIMTLADTLLSDPSIPHGKIAIAFTPDEEVGCGVDHFNLKQFGADYAFTVDGGAIGELEFENFNAAAAEVTVHGVTVHPGEAKGKMKNASLIAMEFADQMPWEERPECTEGYEGFIHLTDMSGRVEQARLSFMGLPCPNLCTGGHNFHGRYEYICVESMEKIVSLLIEIVSEM